jgi:hypothetical protein
MFKYYSHNNLKIGLLITATQFLMASGCNKDSSKPCALVTPYSFNVTSEFTPQKEVYNVGDTIFLTSTFPKTLTNLISNQQVDYSNSVGISGSLGFGLLDSVAKQNIPARDSFSTSIAVGKGSETSIVANRNALINVQYQEQSSYDLKCLIVCKKKGLYMISLSDMISQGLAGKNCTNAGFSMTVINSNKHFNLFQNALGIPMDALGAKSSYCFRVQ